MNDVKGFFASKTVWGAFIAMAPSVAGLFGLNIGGDDVTAAQGLIEQIVTAVGALIAIYGRVTATAKIG